MESHLRNMDKYTVIIDSQLRIIESLNNGRTNKALMDETIVKGNEIGKVNKFYGHRLRLIRTFYGVSVATCSSLLNHYPNYVSAIEHNKTKPTDIEVKILALYFNVDESVFKDEKVYITITEQNKLTIM